MSTTGEAADVDGSGQPATSNSTAVSNSSAHNLTKCSECEVLPAVVFCDNCKVSLCASCDTVAVHTSKATRNHVRIELRKYLMLQHGLGSSTPTDDQLKSDGSNKLCFFSPRYRRIVLVPRLASLVADPDARPSLVSFIGPTGVGKSTLLRLLISLDGVSDEGLMPVVGAASDAQSTSSDLHMYAGRTVHNSQSTVHSTYPLLYVDSEGRGGSMMPLGLRNVLKSVDNATRAHLGLDEHFQKTRYQHAQESYPRMLYIFSDVLCFVFQGNWREQESIVKPLLEWGRSAAVGAANQHRPRLILIFNKTGTEAAEPGRDDFRKTYKNWIQHVNKKSREDLELYYWDPLVCLIPNKDVDIKLVLHRVEMLHREIGDSTMHVRRSREQASQLFTRRQLQLYMQLAADTFSNNPKEDFDIYKAQMAREPTAVGHAGYIIEFRRAVELANSESKSKYKSHRISLNVLQERIALSVQLWIHRLNLPVKLPKQMREALEDARKVIDGDQPCAAACDTIDNCDTLKHTHSSFHVSKHRGVARWKGDFISDPEVKRASEACRLVNLAESADRRNLDIKAIRRELSYLRKSELRQYPWFTGFNFFRACVSCMIELPTEVLSCGHIICARCAKEEADMLSREKIIELTCPVCFSSAKWYPKDLPPLAGYRILSLDGGGVRGIVELLSLEIIMSFFDGMHVEDLFDIIVGTSAGGIIALALTVHQLNKQPKRLPDVIQLFQEFSKEVFSPEMLRVGAKHKYVRVFFQYFRFYDTKYKNDNLLKLLEEYFGQKSLLRSCIGGPHVIVTSCDRDNDLAAAWFTSYHRPMRKDECDDRLGTIGGGPEQPTSKLHSGCLPDNYLISATDAGAATFAAGTYFLAYEVADRFWVDGGMQLNGPAEIGIQEARTLWPQHPASALISLGCGRLNMKIIPSDSLKFNLEGMKFVLTDVEWQCQKAINFLEEQHLGCCVHLNPTIEILVGGNLELDNVRMMPYLMDQTKVYLNTDRGSVDVHKAANLLFAALFYLDVEIDEDLRQPKLDSLCIRSRVTLPPKLKGVLINAIGSQSPFSVIVVKAANVDFEFLWAQCTWEQGIINLPLGLGDLSMNMGLLTIKVNLHCCLPKTTVPTEGLHISGMPCSLGDAN